MVQVGSGHLSVTLKVYGDWSCLCESIHVCSVRWCYKMLQGEGVDLFIYNLPSFSFDQLNKWQPANQPTCDSAYAIYPSTKYLA